MSVIDSHCHLDAEQFGQDRDDIIARAADAGVGTMLSIGTGDGPPDLEAALRLADRHRIVLATAGIHPEFAPKARPEHYKHLADVLRHPKCVGLGEIGLDYYWKPYDPAQQRDVFVEQMRIAQDARKPIIIHTRDAWEDTMALLRDHWADNGLPAVMHCFTGTPAQAEEALGLGFFLSFSGVVTYPKATEVQQAAKQAPPDRILVETDCPYLAPVPYRGKRNEPSYVVHTAQKLAEIREMDYDTIARMTSDNFQRLFINQLH